MPHVDYIGSDNTTWPSATQLTKMLPADWLWAWYKHEVEKNGWAGWQACKKRSDDGAKLGSEVHAVIENRIKETTVVVSKEAYEIGSALFTEAAKRVESWEAIEPHLVSQELRLHGTADAVVRLDNETGLYILDWKTSFKKDISHPIQLAIYAYCWNETHPGLTVDTGLIVRVDKKSTKLTVKIDEYKSLKDFYPIIKALRQVWDYANQQGAWQK